MKIIDEAGRMTPRIVDFALRYFRAQNGALAPRGALNLSANNGLRREEMPDSGTKPL